MGLDLNDKKNTVKTTESSFKKGALRNVEISINKLI